MDPTAPDLHGHLDGYVITFDGQDVAVFPSFLAAATGLRTARQALAMLAATLAGPNPISAEAA